MMSTARVSETCALRHSMWYKAMRATIGCNSLSVVRLRGLDGVMTGAQTLLIWKCLECPHDPCGTRRDLAQEAV